MSAGGQPQASPHWPTAARASPSPPGSRCPHPLADRAQVVARREVDLMGMAESIGKPVHVRERTIIRNGRFPLEELRRSRPGAPAPQAHGRAGGGWRADGRPSRHAAGLALVGSTSVRQSAANAPSPPRAYPVRPGCRAAPGRTRSGVQLNDVFDILPGHDGWTVGDEPCVQIEWVACSPFAGLNTGLQGRRPRNAPLHGSGRLTTTAALE